MHFLIDLSNQFFGIVYGRDSLTNRKDPYGTVHAGSCCLQYPDASNENK